MTIVLDPPEHEGQGHRQASQLMFSLSDMVRVAMLPPLASESSMSTAGACSDWELVLHAFFDGELDAADSLACELHLERCQRCAGELKNLKSMRQKIRRSAVGWAAPGALKSYRLIASFEVTFAGDFSEGIIVIGNLSWKSADRRNCIYLGIKLGLAESPV
jgi:Putative zinc-finger